MKGEGYTERFDAAISLARTSGFKLVAEGVASEQQVQILREAGVRRLQGFWFDRALPADEFAHRLARDRDSAAAQLANG